MGEFDTARFEVEFKNSTLPFLLQSRAEELGDKVFYMFEDQKVTYRQLDTTANRVANALLETLGNPYGVLGRAVLEQMKVG